MRRTALVITAAAALGAILAQAHAGSIWAKAQGRTGMRRVRLYEDDKARAVGDILTIAIEERSVIENETTRTQEKSADRSATANGTVELNDVYGWWGKEHKGTFNLPTVGAQSGASSQFEGTADYESDRSIVDQITVTVQDVLPNGNLVVLGARRRRVDNDLQTVLVGGIVRPSDITFANIVPSSRVAEFHMVVAMKGPENRFTKPGWLGRILNFLSPW